RTRRIAELLERVADVHRELRDARPLQLEVAVLRERPADVTAGELRVRLVGLGDQWIARAAREQEDGEEPGGRRAEPGRPGSAVRGDPGPRHPAALVAPPLGDERGDADREEDLIAILRAD